MSNETDPIPVIATRVPDIRDEIELAILEIDPAVDLEKLQMTWTKLDAVKRFCREAEEKLKPRTVEWIKTNGSFMIGSTEYYVGQEKKTKCLDVKGTVMALLGATGEIIDPISGEALNLEQLTDCMSADAFKPATTVKALGENADKYFRTVVLDKVKKNGADRSELRTIDTEFVR